MSEQQAEAQVISEAKEKLSEVIPTPPGATPVASAQALKEGSPKEYRFVMH